MLEYDIQHTRKGVVIAERLMKGFFSKVFQSQQQMSKHYSSSPNLETLGVITSSRAKGGSSYQKLEQAAFGGLRESIATGPMAL